jgi:hypothetical protein
MTWERFIRVRPTVTHDVTPNSVKKFNDGVL